jgi:hypothetical protein
MSSESTEAIFPTVMYNFQILSAKSKRLPVADKIIKNSADQYHQWTIYLTYAVNITKPTFFRFNRIYIYKFITIG